MEPLESRTLLALTPQLLVDINPTPHGAVVDSPIMQVGNFAYFLGKRGNELWRSDGTQSGTVLIKEIKDKNSEAYFETELGIGASSLANVNGTLYFTANNGTNGYELWKSDGTAAGTLMVVNLRSNGSSNPRWLTNVNGTLYFSATTNVAGLWKSDGTAAGTTQVKALASSNLVNLNGIVYFQGEDGPSGAELWKSDGSDAGTVLVSDIWPGTSDSYPQNITNVGGTLFFSARDNNLIRRLWASDGTGPGTVQVSTAMSKPEHLTNVGGTLFFAARNTSAVGTELWKSDGTSAGTVLVKNIDSRAYAESSPRSLANVNGTLYFSANDGTTGYELWQSDGTEAGTVLLKDLAGRNGGSGPRNLSNVAGTLYFSALVGGDGYELWKSDGTANGTVVVPRAGTDSASAIIGPITTANGKAYFSATDGVNGFELWTSDGTAGGTVMVADAKPGAFGTYPQAITNVNGTLFFAAHEGNGSYALWKSNGTSGGTTRLAGIGTLPIFKALNVNGVLFFAAGDQFLGGTKLWKSDGTVAGTVALKSVSATDFFVNLNGTLLFFAHPNNPELWRSDGTVAGTVLVKSFSDNGSPNSLVNVNGTAFFTAPDGTNGLELWKSDGTANGTVRVTGTGLAVNLNNPLSLTNVNGQLYFSAAGIPSGTALWTSDGSTSGTTLVKQLFGTPDWLVNNNDKLFFSSFLNTVPVAGDELWTSNGRPEGTVMVKDLRPGGGSSYPNNLMPERGVLFFSASSNGNERIQEIWRSDGTNAGTVQLFQIPGTMPTFNFTGILPAMASSSSVLSGRYLFSPDDVAHGRELWVSTVNEVNAAPSGIDRFRLIKEDPQYVFKAEDFGFGDVGNTYPHELLAVKITTLPPRGALELDGGVVNEGQFIPAVDIAAGKLTYRPPTNTAGSSGVTITFQVQDDGGTGGGGFDLDPTPNNLNFVIAFANDAPSGANGSINVLDHVPYTFSFSEFGFSDLNDSPSHNLLGIKITDLPSTGSLTYNGLPVTTQILLPASGNLVYTPPSSAFDTQTALASFPFRVVDNGGTASGGIDTDSAEKTLTINLLGVHNAPTGAGKTVVAAEDGHYAFSVDDFGFGDAGDSPADHFQGVKIKTLPGKGTLKLSGVDILAERIVSVAEIPLLTFWPSQNENGAAYSTFTFQVQDDGGAAGGGGDLDPIPRTMSIDVTPNNDAPNGVDDSLADVAEDSGLRRISFASLLANDVKGPANESGQELTIVAVGNGVGGSVAIDGTDVVFTPAGEFHGAASFSYTLRDNGTTSGVDDFLTSTATVSFAIAEVNDAPLGLDDPLSGVSEDSGDRVIAFSALLENDSTGPADENGQALTITSVGGAVGGSVEIFGNDVIFHLGDDYHGPASFTYTVSDNGTTAGVADFKTSTATASFTIVAVNDAPVGVDDSLASVAEGSGPRSVELSSLLANDLRGAADESGQTLTITGVSSGVGGTVELDGTNVVFTPDVEYNGLASFVYTVQDDGMTGGVNDFKTSEATVSFAVTEVNDPPKGTNDFLPTVAEDFEPRVFAFAELLGNDSKGPANEVGQSLTIIEVRGATGGTVSIVGNDVVFAPAPNFHGFGVFEYVLRDNGTSGGVDDYLTSTAVVGFQISAVNDEPIAMDDGLAAMAEDAGPRVISLAVLMANDSKGPPNEGGQTLTVVAVDEDSAVGGTVTIVGNDVVYEPDADYSGSASFVYTVRDNGLTNGVSDFKSSTATVSFAVTPINDAPSFVKGADQSATDERPTQSVVGWATGLSRGPAGAVDEVNQTLSFVVRTDDETLFAELPSVDEAGTLRFRPAANVRGTAVVTLRIKDSGGTAGGGVDESEVQTFEIEITKPHPMHNAAKAEDVSNDGKRVAGDALDVINFINAFGSQEVALDAEIGPVFYDTTGDNNIAPDDVLKIINYINAFGSGGEGEAEGQRSEVGSQRWDAEGERGRGGDVMELLAMDVAAAQGKRKR